MKAKFKTNKKNRYYQINFLVKYRIKLEIKKDPKLQILKRHNINNRILFNLHLRAHN